MRAWAPLVTCARREMGASWRAAYDGRVNVPLALKAAAVQGACVAIAFFSLVLAPLPETFFMRYGFLAGPLTWLVCAVVTVRILRLPPLTGALAAVVGGATGALVGMSHHDLGIVAGVVAFGAVVGAATERRAVGGRPRAHAGR